MESKKKQAPSQALGEQGAELKQEGWGDWLGKRIFGQKRSSVQKPEAKQKPTKVPPIAAQRTGDGSGTGGSGMGGFGDRMAEKIPKWLKETGEKIAGMGQGGLQGMLGADGKPKKASDILTVRNALIIGFAVGMLATAIASGAGLALGFAALVGIGAAIAAPLLIFAVISIALKADKILKWLKETGQKIVQALISIFQFCKRNFFSLFGLAGIAALIASVVFLPGILATILATTALPVIGVIGVTAAPILALTIGLLALVILFGLGTWLRRKTGMPMPLSEKILYALGISIAVAIGLVMFGGFSLVMGIVIAGIPIMALIAFQIAKGLFNQAKRDPQLAGMVVGGLLLLAVVTLHVLSAFSVVALGPILLPALFILGTALCLPFFIGLLVGKPSWSKLSPAQRIVILMTMGLVLGAGMLIFGAPLAAALGIAGTLGVAALAVGALFLPLLLYGAGVAVVAAVKRVLKFIKENSRLVTGVLGLSIGIAGFFLAFFFPYLLPLGIVMGIVGGLLAIGAAANKIWEQFVRFAKFVQRNAVPIACGLGLVGIGVALGFFMTAGVAFGTVLAVAAPIALLLIAIGYGLAKKPLSTRDKVILGITLSLIVGLCTAGIVLALAPAIGLGLLVGISAGIALLPLVLYGVVQALKVARNNAVSVSGVIAAAGVGLAIGFLTPITAFIAAGQLAFAAPFVLPIVIGLALLTMGIGLLIRLTSDKPLSPGEKAFLSVAVGLGVGVIASFLTGGLMLGLILGPLALVACGVIAMRETITKNPVMSGVVAVGLGAAAYVGLAAVGLVVGPVLLLALFAAPILMVILAWLSGQDAKPEAEQVTIRSMRGDDSAAPSASSFSPVGGNAQANWSWPSQQPHMGMQQGYMQGMGMPGMDMQQGYQQPSAPPPPYEEPTGQSPTGQPAPTLDSEFPNVDKPQKPGSDQQDIDLPPAYALGSELSPSEVSMSSAASSAASAAASVAAKAAEVAIAQELGVSPFQSQPQPEPARQQPASLEGFRAPSQLKAPTPKQHPRYQAELDYPWAQEMQRMSRTQCRSSGWSKKGIDGQAERRNNWESPQKTLDFARGAAVGALEFGLQARLVATRS